VRRVELQAANRYKRHVLDFRILGPVEVWRDGEPVPLGSAKQRAALALLILEAGTEARAPVELHIGQVGGKVESSAP